ncbi:hypothetical protein [Flammeovirga sp. OC4]|uniref:hypothetical protein n=1 Tax=Flammeovirga sp. OC4 TaxID=1382345 RepID=UPI0012DFEBB5|nr:hypothetical protein [Flammeovirga sp. OC4]
MLNMTQYPLRIKYPEAKEKYGDHTVFRQNLNAQEIEFVESRKLEGRFSLKELYHLIHKFSLYYTLIKGKRDRTNGYGIFGSLALAALVFVAYVKYAFFLGIFLFVLLVVTVGLTIYFRNQTKYSPFEINNEEVLKCLVYILLQDFGPKQKVDISLDCTPVKEDGKIIDRFKRGVRNIVIYKKEYLKLKFSIGESVKVVLHDDCFFRTQNWKKRSSSGKLKYKKKENALDKISYKVLFDCQYYEVMNSEYAHSSNTNSGGKPNLFELNNGMWEYKSKLKLQDKKANSKDVLNQWIGFLQQPFLQIKKK